MGAAGCVRGRGRGRGVVGRGRVGGVLVAVPESSDSEPNELDELVDEVCPPPPLPPAPGGGGGDDSDVEPEPAVGFPGGDASSEDDTGIDGSSCKSSSSASICSEPPSSSDDGKSSDAASDSDSSTLSEDSSDSGSASDAVVAGGHLDVAREAALYCDIAGGRYGTLRYKASDNTICAHCPMHDECTATRTLNEDAHDPYASGRGRPIGFLTSWLMHADRFATKAQHKKFKPDFAARFEARGQFLLEPMSFDLLMLERDAHPFEGEEPLTFQAGERPLGSY